MSVEWLPARLDLLQAEKEHSRRGDELARRQQALPWVRIDKTYRFDTEAMTSTAGAERCAATDGIKAVSFGAPFAPFSPFVNPPLVVACKNSSHRARAGTTPNPLPTSNRLQFRKKPMAAKAPRKSAKARRKPAAKPVRLAGGNPHIPMADGDAPVQAYIAAMPGWKRDIGRRLDALIVKTVPTARKAVRWNSPFYGIEGRGWFLAFHVYARYVKVTFFRGTSLRPAPTGGKSKEARWIDVHEDDLDEAQMTAWVKQAAALPGWVP